MPHTKKVKSKFPKPQAFKIKTGLSRKEALKAAPKPRGDFRGFTYSPKTGKGGYR